MEARLLGAGAAERRSGARPQEGHSEVLGQREDEKRHLDGSGPLRNCLEARGALWRRLKAI
jgi:hypothetical protein